MSDAEDDASARAVQFRICPRCGRDNGATLLLDQPCEPRVYPPGRVADQ